MPPRPAQPAQFAALLAQLRDVRLPSLAAEADRAIALADNVELRRLQALAEHEPGLALEILLQVNARRGTDEDLRGLQQGIHLLGSGGVQRLLRQQRVARFDANQPGHLLCLQAMATSRLAWLYLAHWLRAALASDEDSRLSILTLLGVSRWKLPLAQPQLAARIEQRVEAGERRVRVERELLGIDLDTLNAWHLQDLGLKGVEDLVAPIRPGGRLIAEAARRAWARELAPEMPGPLKSRLRERLLGCGLAYALALETQVDWHGPRARSLLRASSTWLARPLDETQRGVWRQALYASGEAVFTRGLRAPAVGLLWPPRPARSLPARGAGPIRVPEQTAPARTPPVDTARAHAEPKPTETADAVAAYVQRCEAGHGDLRGLLGDSVRLFAGLGLHRCALFLRQVGNERLACYFSYGFAEGLADRTLAVDAEGPGLFSLLLAQPGAAFRIAPAQLAGLGSKLPAELRNWPPATGLLLAAVSVQARTVGFWWADAGNEGPQTDVEQFAGFRRAAAAFGPAFTRLLKARKQASNGP